MFKVERRDYGLEFLFVGSELPFNEVKELITIVKRLLGYGDQAKMHFYFDLRGLNRLNPETIKEFVLFRKFLITNYNAKRSVYILDSAVIQIQLKRIAKELGVFLDDRYIEPINLPGWEDKAIAWLINAQEPVPKKRKW